MNLRVFQKNVLALVSTFCLAVCAFAETVVRAEESVWAYSWNRAPLDSPAIGVWGDGKNEIFKEAKSVPFQNHAFSYGYVMWELPEDCSEAIEAYIELYPTSDKLGVNHETAMKESPLVAWAGAPLSQEAADGEEENTTFDLGDWDDESSKRPLPKEKVGLGVPSKTGQPYRINLDLKKLKTWFSLEGNALITLIFTSKIQGTQDRKNYYEFHGAPIENDSLKPKLVFKYKGD